MKQNTQAQNQTRPKMSKGKLIALLVVMLIALGALVTFLSFILLSAVGVTKNGINYRFIPSKWGYYVAEIDLSEASSDIVIPEKINSLPVIELPDYVFQDGGAFSDYYSKVWNGVTSIHIPKSVTTIGNCFSGGLDLINITIAKDNPVFHSENNCIIETSTKTLIAGCKASIIPDDGSVTTIKSAAFKNCVGLTNITVPQSVETIEKGAFNGCTNLSSITIPFVGNSRVVDASNEQWTTDAVVNNFNYIFGTYNSDVPSTLHNVIITDGTDIGGHAFSGCNEITNITIPSSVTHIGVNAFNNCTRLKNITFNGTTEQWNKISKDSGWNNNANFTIHCSNGTLFSNSTNN